MLLVCQKAILTVSYKSSILSRFFLSLPITSAITCCIPTVTLLMDSSPATSMLIRDSILTFLEVLSNDKAASSNPSSLAFAARVFFLVSLNGAY